MFALGTGEIVGIVAVVVLLFGARKIPELARSLGQGIREFRKSAKSALDDDEKAEEPKDKE